MTSGNPQKNSTARRKRCGARRGKGRGICRMWAMPNGRCRIHGGLTPMGPALPQFKHGRYSKFLTGGLRSKYEEAARDTNLHSLNDEIRLIDALLKDRVSKLSRQDGGRINEARKLLEDCRAAGERGDAEAAERLLDQLSAALEAESADAGIRGEVVNLVEQRSRLVEREARIRHQASHSLSESEVRTFSRAFGVALYTHVKDPETIRKITADLRAFGVLQRPQLPAPVDV